MIMDEDQAKLSESEKLAAFLAVSDDNLPEIPIKEELVEEVMQQLWNEINYYKGGNTKTASSPESCGPAFSDSSSTVMAGFQVSKADVPGGEVSKPAVEKGVNEVEGVEVLGEEVNGCDEKEVDDEWLARVLSNWGPQELDEWI